MLCGKGSQPSKDVFHKLVTESYEASPKEKVGGLTLIRHTPTLKFYLGKDNTIVVGIRGTFDAADVKADALIGTNALGRSARFKADLATLQQFQKEYSPSDYDYYGVGHSLGGAILDLFLAKGLLKSGVSYNPAIQPLDIRKENKNHRIYFIDDPLYRLMGQFSIKPEVRNRTTWKEFAFKHIPIVGTVNAHQLDRFKGGAIPSLISLAKDFVVSKKRLDYPPVVRKMLEQDGSRKVTRIDVCRTPLPWTVRALLQGLSLGKFESKMKEAGYDELFHLYLRVELDGGQDVVLVEKNQVLNISRWKSDPKDQECIPVSLAGDHTLMELLEGGRKDLGEEDFFIYDAFGRNCQQFVLGILRASKLLTPEIRKFIYQPTTELVQKLGPNFAKTAKTLTDIAHGTNVILYGKGEYEAEF